MRNKFFKLALSAVLSVSCLAAGFTGTSGLDGNANNISKDGTTSRKSTSQTEISLLIQLLFT